MNTYCVYILASERNGTLYLGVTNDLEETSLRAQKQFSIRLFFKVQNLSVSLLRGNKQY